MALDFALTEQRGYPGHILFDCSEFIKTIYATGDLWSHLTVLSAKKKPVVRNYELARLP